jgi:hypothetical protein
MSTAIGQDESSASRDPKQAVKQRPWPRFDVARFRSLRNVSRKSLTISREFASYLWRTLPSYLPFYLLAIVVGYAAWLGQTSVTIIAPFQMPKGDLPFSGEIVADMLQDALTSIQVDFGRESRNPRSRSPEIGLPDLRNMLLHDLQSMHIFKFRRISAPPSFKVEVKGLSPEGIISVARTVMGTETTVSGDIILKGKKFIMIARTANAGPWQSISSPITERRLATCRRSVPESNGAMDGLR